MQLRERSALGRDELMIWERERLSPRTLLICSQYDSTNSTSTMHNTKYCT